MRKFGLAFIAAAIVACATAGGGGDTPDAGDGGGGGGNIGSACVKNDDCVPPGNLCEGNNGVECKNGYCVATGLPANCNDGVSCTEDSCDANKGKCLHKINDALCPAMSYCDPTLNCVQSLPCMPGDSVCDRLNIDSCQAQWTCDPNKKLCVKGTAPCPDRAHAKTTCTMGMPPMCKWTCDMGFTDINGDLMAPPNQMSNGCECNQMQGPDKPDLMFLDTDCDGIDGTESKAIFVDGVSGNDNNPGTKASPKKTIGSGITAANAANPKKDVYVSKGNYAETVTMADGVSIYGAYDASAMWSRSNMNTTTIAGTGSVGVLGANMSVAVEIQLFTITSQNAVGTNGNGDGRSSVGVLLVNDSGGVTVRGCTINAGTGANAANGGKGSTGAGGGNGGSANGTSQGGQGASACGAPGGAGGPGPGCTAPGNNGTSGTTAANGGAGANFGSGGASGVCNLTSSSDGGPAPPVGANGGQGNPGSNGNAGANLGALDSSGNYLTPPGGSGVSAGYPGGGGGGGGSGGGSAHGTNFFCTDCSCVWGGGGGGGGGGGCGGNPGAGGRGGGGSFAIAIVASAVTVDGTKMTTANGGNGGNGGDGGNGGGGGQPGSGSAGQTQGGGCSTRSGGSGAAGSAGGAGGNGGAGAGGTGGPSVCILYKGSTPTTMGTMCTNGGAGSPGTGGTNGVQQAPSGTQGVTGDLKASN